MSWPSAAYAMVARRSSPPRSKPDGTLTGPGKRILTNTFGSGDVPRAMPFARRPDLLRSALTDRCSHDAEVFDAAVTCRVASALFLWLRVRQHAISTGTTEKPDGPEGLTLRQSCWAGEAATAREPADKVSRAYSRRTGSAAQPQVQAGSAMTADGRPARVKIASQGASSVTDLPTSNQKPVSAFACRRNHGTFRL